MASFKNYFKKIKIFIDKLSKKPKIGALVIRDSSLQFVLIDRKEVFLENIKLPPNVISKGRIKDKELFEDIIKKFYLSLIAKKFKNKKNYRIKAIINLPSEIVFFKNFDIPNVGDNLIDQSAYLNLQMLSPIKSEEGYYSWQKIGSDLDKIYLIGGVIFKEIVDEYKEILENNGFSPIVFEFSSLALSRLIKEILAVENKLLLVIEINSEGLDMFCLKNGYLYFNHFRNWEVGENKEISKEVFEKTLVEEVRLVLNFSLNQLYEEIKQSILIAPNLEELTLSLLNKNFPNLKVYPLKTINLEANKISAFWFSGVGTALRALRERQLDTEISLSELTSIEEYYREQILDFSIFWRNIFISVLGFFLIVYVGLNIFLVNYVADLREQLERVNIQPLTKELSFYKEVENKFNNLVGLVSQVLVNQPKVKNYEILEKLNQILTKENVRVKSLKFFRGQNKMELVLVAKDTATVFNLKNKVSEESYFKNNDLPLTELKNEAEGVVFKLIINLSY